MKARPIKFSGEMVRAIIDGRKTQTRRPVKFESSGRVRAIGSPKNWHIEDTNVVLACHYGQPGDRLVVVGTDIALEITAVRVERVQDISESHLVAEGIDDRASEWRADTFRKLWNSFYHDTKHVWSLNPWVWVVEFEVAK